MRHAIEYDISNKLTYIQRNLYCNVPKYGLPLISEFIDSSYQLPYHNYHITRL